MTEIRVQVREGVAEPAEGGLASVAHISTGDTSGVDGVLFRSDTHWFVFWTSETENGRRAVVALESRPLGCKMDGAVPAWVRTSYQSLLDDPPRAAQIAFTTLRQRASAREALRERADFIEEDVRVRGFEMPDDLGHLTTEEGMRALLVLDAAIYAEAVKAGLSPVEQVAKRHGITDRTAEGRIYRARKAGILSAAGGRWASGELTPKGERLMRKILKVGAAR